MVIEIASAHPDGRERGSRQSDLAIVDADGTGLRRLTRTAAIETHPVWSPDGRRIAFVSDRHRNGGRPEIDERDFELYTMSAEGGHFRRITHNRVADDNPSWQPRR